MSGFSAGLTARSIRRPSKVVNSRIIAETPSRPGRAPGRKSTSRSRSLSGRISPRAAEPNRDSSLTWWRRQMSAIADSGNSIPAAMVIESMRETGGEGEIRDRKSTRLNSSHLGISYAVFCLKKKTEKDYRARWDENTYELTSLEHTVCCL